MQLGTVGSGLDVESIVKALVDAEVAPKNNALNRKEIGLQSELTAIGSLKSVLSSLDTSLSGLTDGTAFDATSIESPDSVSITQTGSVTSGQMSIDISSLASSQVLATAGFSGADTVVGTGTLTIQVGVPAYTSGSSGAYSSFTADSSKTVAITIDSSNNTLSGVRDAINASNASVTASLVLDGTQTRLLLTANDEGAGNAISVITDDGDENDSDASGLSQLAYNVTAGFDRLTEARSSSDASFTLNGLALTSSSNTIVGLVDGLDFTLKKVTSSPDSIIVSSDVSAIEASVQAFVDSYNAYQTKLSALTDYTNIEGALSGDATARRIQSSLRSITTGVQSLSGNTYTALSDIGITSDQYGKLSLSSSDFQAAVSSNASAVKTLFAGPTITTNLSDNTDATGLADSLRTSIETYVNSSSGMLSLKENRIGDAIDDITDDRSKVIERMASLEERYTKQFTAMDTLVGRLQGTSDFLTNQMDALKAAANR